MARGPAGSCLAVVACLLTCCASGSASNRDAVEIRLEDFKLHLSATKAPSGAIRLHLDNIGPSTHELNVDRTDLLDAQLPLREDGLSVDEASPLLTRKGSIEILEAGDKANLDLDLPPGHYVLYCNLEGHYLGQMYATIDVH